MWWKVPAQYFQIEAPRTCRLSEGNRPPIPNESACKKKHKRKENGREKCEEEIVITNQTEGDSRSLHFSCNRVSVFLFAILVSTHQCVDGAFYRFAGHMHNVSYQNVTKKKKTIVKYNSSGTCWCPACEGKSTARARERKEEEKTETDRRVKITKVVKK